MTVINTNSSVIRASNASIAANKLLGLAMERLSTGKRINSAKDDAAGFAISSSMTSQSRGMSQGIRNANDGISLAQTADGALNEVADMLQRIRELAVQSASGTYQDATDRAYMQTEADALTSQNDQVIAMPDLTTLAASGGAAGSYDLSTAAAANGVLANLDTELDTISGARSTMGAGQNRLDTVVANLTSNITNLSGARSRIEDADYSAETSAMAKAQILSQASTAMIAQANQSQQNVLSLLK